VEVELYVLDKDGEPRLAAFTDEFSDFYKGIENRRLKVTLAGSIRISTVFLGLDHNFSGVGPPVLWETMVFGRGDRELDCRRYSSRAEALAGHEEVAAVWDKGG
jgi:hypothetical protein